MPPPAGNVSAPLNVSTTTQYKGGALGIGGLFQTDKDAYLASFSGKVGIGTTSPGGKLVVNMGNNNNYFSVNNDNNIGLELRSGTSGGTPYIDFSNNATSDHDMRLRLTGNDTLAIEGGVLQTGFLVYSDGYINAFTYGSPTYAIHASGGTGATAIRGDTDAGIGVSGISTLSGIGVQGQSNTGTAVSGISTSGNGVVGTSSSGFGVYGVNGQAPGGGFGVYGESPSNYGIYCNGASCGGNKAWSVTSDERLKTNITTIESALAKVEKLRGVSFEWKNSNKTDIGFIAQEVKNVIPEIVSKNGPDGYYTMETSQLTAVLVEAIKEQQKQIETQQKEIDWLKEEISSLRSTN